VFEDEHEHDSQRTHPVSKELRTFLTELENEEPEQVLRVKREVDPHFEVTGVLAKLEQERKFPVVIFEKVKGSNLPVVTNVHADARRLFRAIGLKNATISEFLREYSAREDSLKKPVIVKEAPVQEIVITGKDIDVTRLPILTYHEKDAGRYIWQAYERQNRPTPMAVAIGHHPAFYLGCLSFTSLETDEFSVAGGIMGEPVELVPCRTIDLEVPAHAEIVLECEILPRLRKAEAPFGEYPGTYGPQRNNPIVQVKAITMRRNALYQSSFVGHADNLLLSGIVRSTTILKTVKIASPKVRAVHVPASGRCRFICYVSIEKIIEGDPKTPPWRRSPRTRFSSTSWSWIRM
jgi:2,5-furandicarboxylate decarboxylase 1